MWTPVRHNVSHKSESQQITISRSTYDTCQLDVISFVRRAIGFAPRHDEEPQNSKVRGDVRRSYVLTVWRWQTLIGFHKTGDGFVSHGNLSCWLKMLFFINKDDNDFYCKMLRIF